MKKFFFLLAAILLLPLSSKAVTAVEEGVSYYIFNEKTGYFLGGQNDWGTRATFSEDANLFQLVKGTTGEGYNLVNTYVTVADKNLGGNLYVDNVGTLTIDGTTIDGIWTLEDLGDGNFALKAPAGTCPDNAVCAGGYLTVGATKGVRKGLLATLGAEVSDLSTFKFLTRAEVDEIMYAASLQKNVSFNYAIVNPDFCRNQTNVTAWTQVTNTTGNKNFQGGAANNYCAETFCTQMEYYQTISLPAGKYLLSGQAFYDPSRSGTSDEENLLPYIYVADGEGTELALVNFPKKTSSAYSMTAASDEFTAGHYQMPDVEFELAEGGDIRLGVKTQDATMWVIWDNFRIMSNNFNPYPGQWEEFVADFEPKAAILDAAAKEMYDNYLQAIIVPETSEDLANAKMALTAAFEKCVRSQTSVGANMTPLMPTEWTNQTNTYSTGYERYSTTSFEPGKIIYQTIEGLTPGYYEVSFRASAALANWDGQVGAGPGIAQVYVNDVTEDIEVLDVKSVDYNDDFLHTIVAEVTDGTLEYGIQNIAAGGCWYVCQAMGLKYMGTEKPFEPFEIKTQDGKIYKAVAKNIVVNGSFETVEDGVITGWQTTTYSKDALTANIPVTTEGGVDGGAFATVSAAGKGAATSLMQSIAVEVGKTYYFAAYTNGAAPSAGNYNYNALFSASEIGDHETGVIAPLTWGDGTSWHLTEKVFEAAEPAVNFRMSWNSGSQIDDVQIYEVEYVGEDAELVLAAAKEAALNALPVGDESIFTPSAEAVEAVKAAIEAATTVAEVEAAAAAEWVIPALEGAYQLQNVACGLYFGDAKLSEEPVSVTFEAAANGYYIKVNDELYVNMAGGNTWSMNATAEAKTAWNFTLADGVYTIKGPNGNIGVDYGVKAADNTDANLYGNKSGNGTTWTIAAFEAPEEGPVTLSDLALTVAEGEAIDEDGDFKVTINYAITLNDPALEEASNNLSVVAQYSVYDAEGNKVDEGKTTPSLSANSRNIYISDLVAGQEYTAKLDGFYVIDRTNADYETNWGDTIAVAVDCAEVKFIPAAGEVKPIDIKNMTITADANTLIDEDGDYMLTFNYAAQVNDESITPNDVYAVIKYQVYDEEYNYVDGGTRDFDLTESSRNVYVSNLEAGKTYMFMVTGLVVQGAEGEIINLSSGLPKLTFKVKDPNAPQAITMSDMAFTVAEGEEIDEDGDFKVTFNYEATINDASAVQFPFATVSYVVTDEAGTEICKVPGSFDISSTSKNFYISNLEAGKTYTITATMIEIQDFMTMEMLCEMSEGLPTLTFTVPGAEPEVQTIEIAFERISGKGYEAEAVEYDEAEILAALGAESWEQISMYPLDLTTGQPMDVNYDGWFNKAGVPTEWASQSDENPGGLCLKYPHEGAFSLCTRPEWEPAIGDKLSAGWQLGYNDKVVNVVVNVDFIEAPAIEIAILDGYTTKVSVDYTAGEGDYTEKIIELDENAVKFGILSPLGLSDLSEATVYGYNPSDASLCDWASPFDGWRDAEGNCHTWTGSPEAPTCAKWIDNKIYCYNISATRGEHTATFAFSNGKEAVLVEVTFLYPSEETGIASLSGKSLKDGKYIINNKVVIVKDGKKFNTSGARIIK